MKQKKIRVRIVAELVIDDHTDLTNVATSIEEAIDALTNYRNNTFDPDPYQSAYNAGQRSVAVFVHNVIDQDIDEARKLLGEKKDG